MWTQFGCTPSMWEKQFSHNTALYTVSMISMSYYPWRIPFPSVSWIIFPLLGHVHPFQSCLLLCLVTPWLFLCIRIAHLHVSVEFEILCLVMYLLFIVLIWGLWFLSLCFQIIAAVPKWNPLDVVTINGICGCTENLLQGWCRHVHPSFRQIVLCVNYYFWWGLVC